MYKNPKIFISSTIFDFYDLRSALRYYLSSQGFDVLLSEYNDFTKKLDENTFQSCLNAIEDCDYYILFIGSRVGGFYNMEDNISITQMEYRKAYDQLKKGKLQLLIFIRKDLWVIRDDRNAMKELLLNEYKNKYEISDEDLDSIYKHNSNFINDADFIFKFLNEVGRDEEMECAIEGKGEFPIGNWLHSFNNFEDIVDALRIAFNIKKDLSYVALIQNLKYELYANLKLIVEKQNSDIYPKNIFGALPRIHFTGGVKSKSKIPSQYMFDLSIYSMFGVGYGSKLKYEFINQALYSGKFLEYDKTDNSFRSGLVNNGLLNLKDNINQLQRLEELFQKNQIEYVRKYREASKLSDTVIIDNDDLVLPFAIYDCQENIRNLLIGLIGILDGNDNFLKNLKLHHTSPIEEVAERMKKAIPNNAELEEYVKSILIKQKEAE